MSRYSISQIVLFTGINGHSLRIWERRYKFLKPKRTATNIRYYSDAELRQLLNIKVLLAHGYKISKIDEYTDQELKDLALEVTKGSILGISDIVYRLTLSMMDYDEEMFNDIYINQSNERGPLPFIIDVIYPFLDRVGMLWCSSKASIAEEHFITNLIRQKIIAEIDRLPPPSSDANSVVLFLFNNEDHEIGLLLASFIIKSLGFKGYYLGQKVPLDNVKNFLNKIKPDLIVTMYTISKPATIMSNLSQLREFIDCKIGIAGNEKLLNSLTLPSNVVALSKPSSLINLLKGE